MADAAPDSGDPWIGIVQKYMGWSYGSDLKLVWTNEDPVTYANWDSDFTSYAEVILPSSLSSHADN